MPIDLPTSLFPPDHQNRLETETHWFQLSWLRNRIHSWLCHSLLHQELYGVEMAELVWQGFRMQTASFQIQIPEVWGLGSPQHVPFNKHSHTWPFPQAALSVPSQRLQFSTLARAPPSRTAAFQPQVDLGRGPQTLILLVKVETLQPRFLFLASLLRFLGVETHATSSRCWAGQKHCFVKVCVYWIGLALVTRCWDHAEANGSWASLPVSPDLA